jgi:hypothetical protein
MRSIPRVEYDWTFRGFETPAGNRPVADWIRGLSEDALDELFDILRYMKIRPHHEWDAEHFRPLDDGISELRFHDANSICRIYGYFGPTWFRQSYTFLIGSAKKVKNDVDSKSLARTRRDHIEATESGFHPFSFEE